MMAPDGLFDSDFQAVYGSAARPGAPPPFPSPADWRDCPIYFLMVDRFNGAQPPAHAPFDDPNFSGYQGGKFSGVRAQLSYIKALGAGAIWLSPALKNLPFATESYHGYGIHDFLHAEPRFADNPAAADDELRELVDAAHAQGLYVIFDIVLNHVGDAFAYVGDGSYHPAPQPVAWRDKTGAPRRDWPDIEHIPSRDPDALVWPKELQRQEFFRRQGAMPAPQDDTIGDFMSLKQMRSDNPDLQNFLIRAYQYVIARYDVDGFRIDTLRYLKGGLPLLFGNAVREFALAIGKKNFFTYGEIWTNDSEPDIARFIGRNSNDGGDFVGVDAALDYPLFDVLKPAVKGFTPPAAVVDMYQRRKAVEKYILSSHGDATRYFVTFLDNHDVKERLRHRDSAQQAMLDNEVTLGLACLYALPGIPCLYYGTEQGLTGAGTADPAVREALWGGPGFEQANPFYKEIAKIGALRASVAALRYGRVYFRQLSGDGRNFGFSRWSPGVLAFSRILNDREILVVANFVKSDSQTLHVVVDNILNPAGRTLQTLYSNKVGAQPPGPVLALAGTTSTQVDGSTSSGTLNAAKVSLLPGEVQILG
jgi:glycosidase